MIKYLIYTPPSAQLSSTLEHVDLALALPNPIVAIWRQRSGSTLAQVVAVCVTALTYHRRCSVAFTGYIHHYPFLYARLKNGTYYAVAMSVRPSVRPCFPDFTSTCFEISIWNLVYTFSRWHDMSNLSCIKIGSLWPSLQPKVGQTYFLQSRPHKSR